jgi:hypothetical protein
VRPATALRTTWQAAEPERWPWQNLVTDAATVVVTHLDDEAAQNTGLLAALSSHPDAHPRGRPMPPRSGRPSASCGRALITATDTLARLDVARWRDVAAGLVAAVRSGNLPTGALPPSAPGRTARVLAAAAGRAIVDLAAEDDGAAITGHEAQTRATALRGAGRRLPAALAAAVNGMREPHPRP